MKLASKLQIPSEINGPDLSVAERPLPDSFSPQFVTIFAAKASVATTELEQPVDIESPIFKFKSQCMSDICKYLDNDKADVPEDLRTMIVNIIAANCIRKLPFVPKEQMYLDDFTFPAYSMPLHPTIGYSILIRFFQLYPADNSFTVTFLRRLIDMTASFDGTEREMLILFFTHILKAKPDVVHGVIGRIEELIVDFMSTGLCPTRIWACMKILNQYFVSIDPSMFSDFFLQIIAPLCNHDFFTFFDLQYSEMSVLFPEHGASVVDIMLKHWPRQSIPKQVSFIFNIMIILPNLEEEEVNALTPPFFKILAECINMHSPRLALTAINIWTNDEGADFVARMKNLIFPYYAPAIFQAMEKHWNEDVRAAATDTSSFLMTIDEELALAATTADNIKSEADTMENWLMMAQAASEKSGIDISGFDAKVRSTFLR
ncbi:protein phosphatase regulator protein [Trichomonas vaginalis G3]|nr:protein phosphatase regulator protein [Trichomonas vaginalis G3]KAI5528673.1 protein phosphatase regulator protein [Trichomonas vaginalis G3]